MSDKAQLARFLEETIVAYLDADQPHNTSYIAVDLPLSSKHDIIEYAIGNKEVVVWIQCDYIYMDTLLNILGSVFQAGKRYRTNIGFKINKFPRTEEDVTGLVFKITWKPISTI